MRILQSAAAAVVVVALTASLTTSVGAQEAKPVPKNSVRVSIPGCSRNYLFTVGPRSADEAGSNLDIPEGMRLRMNGPKKLMAEIKAHQGSMIELTGVMKKGQYKPDGVGLGGGVRLGPSGGPGSAALPPASMTNQPMIDVEGWRPIAGNCS
jgi:hypothetical protein